MRRMNMDQVLVGVSMLTIGVVAVSGLQPRGRVSTWLAERKQTQQRAEVINQQWDSLVLVGQRIGESTGHPLLLEFSDYECPYCRRSHAEVSTWLDRHPSGALVYVHLPLPSHPFAKEAAAAALCSEAEGVFPQLHERLMSEDSWRAPGGVVALAGALGIRDTVALADCMRSPQVEARLRFSARLAGELGVGGTPAFVGRRAGLHLGAITADELDRVR